MENLLKRAEILGRIRAFFDARGFVEVMTPVLIAAPAPEPHIDCPTCGKGFLRASPELQMKKLLAAGMEKIYEIGPCFREGELGARHNPEFTMIEWYRKGATYLDIKKDLEDLLASFRSPSPSSSNFPFSSSSNFPFSIFHFPFSTLTVREAYRAYAGWDPFETFDQDRFDYDMATKIEPAIRQKGGGVFLMDYPSEAASLAKLRDGVAERWEFYCDGIELANCFTELCDAEEQRRRFCAAKEERARLGESDYPIDEEFLNLLPLVGSAAGVALGVDRLVAALCGEDDIHSVMAPE